MNDALLSSKNMCWCTPPDFFAELDREFHFELDPASTDKSAKCAKHFTPDDDGLKQDWGGYRVFCNPPYGRAIADWVRKGYEESRKPGTTVVMLIPSRTDTAYFHDWIFGKYDTNEIDGVLFATAEAKRKAAAGMKNLSVSAAAEFDFGLHLYLGYAAIVAVNPTYDFSDLERMKGADVVEVMALGRNFMLKSEPEPQENDSAEPTATTPESTTPARQSSKKSE